MDMRLGRSARVPAETENLSLFHFVATLDPDASLLEMAKDRHFMFTVHKDDRIASGKARIHGAGCIIPNPGDDIRNNAIRRGQDRPAKGIVILVLLAFALMGPARFIDNHKVESEALMGPVAP